MSILSKITILFFISILLMGYISFKTNDISQKNFETSIRDKYIQASKNLFDILMKGDNDALVLQAKAVNFRIIDPGKYGFQKAQKISYSPVSFGYTEVLKNNDGYFLHLHYLDEDVFFFDNTQVEEIGQKKILNLLILADVLILIVMFFVITKMLMPLRRLPSEIEKFGKGDYTHRIKEQHNSDEIAKVIFQFNTMAQNIATLIKSRMQFLTDISHELRTPISKAKLSLEMIETSKYKDILKKSIDHIDTLTNELLEVEKLSSNNLNLSFSTYNIETLLAKSLAKMLVDNEKELHIEVQIPFHLHGDIEYLSIAIKNMLDNALKYKTGGIVRAIATDNILEIRNLADPLTKPLSFYTDAFTQEDSTRMNKGYGLGLNIVKRILELHNFTLDYYYDNGEVVFVVDFNKQM
ncbi:MAG: ArsS family sensor histidine kinase [Sulfurovaceae bacterium]|nr:ArsS family sensor histidine kinase [Sulfurovaceae bacterium]